MDKIEAVLSDKNVSDSFFCHLFLDHSLYYL